MQMARAPVTGTPAFAEHGVVVYSTGQIGGRVALKVRRVHHRLATGRAQMSSCACRPTMSSGTCARRWHGSGSRIMTAPTPLPPGRRRSLAPGSRRPLPPRPPPGAPPRASPCTVGAASCTTWPRSPATPSASVRRPRSPSAPAPPRCKRTCSTTSVSPCRQSRLPIPTASPGRSATYVSIPAEVPTSPRPGADGGCGRDRRPARWNGRSGAGTSRTRRRGGPRPARAAARAHR